MSLHFCESCVAHDDEPFSPYHRHHCTGRCRQSPSCDKRCECGGNHL